MALIVEDGSRPAGADSFFTLEAIDAYWADRNLAAWAAATTAAKEAAARQAAEYLTFAYAWAGYKVSSSQSLSWPRYEVPDPDAVSSSYGGQGYVDHTTVPTVIVRAAMMLAAEALSSNLLTAPTVNSTGLIKREAVQVGSLKREREYVLDQTDVGALPRFPNVDAMLAPYARQQTGQTGGTRVMVRR